MTEKLLIMIKTSGIISALAMILYRALEILDGERFRFVRFIPYKSAQKLKIKLFDWMDY